MASLGSSIYKAKSATRPNRHAKSPNKRKAQATRKKYRGQGRV